MNRRTVLSLAATAFVALLSSSPPLPAQTQFPGAVRTGPGGFAGMRAPNIVDPSRSAINILIKRDDVRSQILLTAKQREALDGADPQQPQIQQEMTQKIQALISELRNVSPAERQAKMQEMQGQIQQIAQEYQSRQDKKVEEILKPEQLARLHELDLQWRGPLALSDQKVAEPYNLTPDQKTKINAALKEYQDVQRTAITSIMAGFRRGNQGAPGGNGGAVGNGGAPAAGNQPPTGFTRPTPEEMQRRMAEVEKTSEKALKAGSDKVLALLTPEQKQQWVKALGKLFTFRKYQ
jgi:hypothetical protein